MLAMALEQSKPSKEPGSVLPLRLEQIRYLLLFIPCTQTQSLEHDLKVRILS